MKSPARVAFTLDTKLLAWTGGYNYLRNLLGVLRSQPTSNIQPVLFCGEDIDPNDFGALRSLVREPVVISPELNAGRMVLKTIATLLSGNSAGLAKVFKKHRTNVVFESARFFGRRFEMPTLAWIPDFQHRHLPEMFSRAAYYKRELGFRLQLGATRTVMVSSEAARRDCVSFYGVDAEKIVVVPFAAVPGIEAMHANPDEIRRRYQLPSTFFFLPNQFWKHKNHEVVCRAVALLKRRGEDVCVAVSGRQDDYRHPDVFKDIMSYVQRESIEESFRLLGEIPYSHLIAIMRASTALVNPSLFEGWSSTVEEAKSLGVPSIVSDLPVHREQLGVNASYFNPGSETQLADILGRASKSWPPGPRPDNEAVAANATRLRAAKFASAFEGAVARTVQNAVGR